MAKDSKEHSAYKKGKHPASFGKYHLGPTDQMYGEDADHEAKSAPTDRKPDWKGPDHAEHVSD